MMPEKALIRAEADRLRSLFEAEGAEVMEFDILQPAGMLLDLYGEDIRGRAFVTHDPVQGEMMLRPDFTVPLVSRLVAEGRRSGRFTYAGEVFRRQEDMPDRDAEYLQVGVEIFGGDPAETDADVFSLIAKALSPLKLNPVIGDIGLLRDAVLGLSTSDARKQALLHHLWRPGRFRKLMTRFARQGTTPEPQFQVATRAPQIGRRGMDEITARIAALEADRSTPPLPPEEVRMIEELASLRAVATDALSRLQDIAVDLPCIAVAVDRMDVRLQALSARGVDVRTLSFDGGYGRSSMEYYDGFVFGFAADGQPSLPPVATGGRYDALTHALGDAIPAVGAVIRPGVALALEGG